MLTAQLQVSSVPLAGIRVLAAERPSLCRFWQQCLLLTLALLQALVKALPHKAGGSLDA